MYKAALLDASYTCSVCVCYVMNLVYYQIYANHQMHESISCNSFSLIIRWKHISADP